MGRPPLVRLDGCNTLLQRQDHGVGKSGTLEALSVAFDNVVAEDFALRGTKSCGHVRLGGPGPSVTSRTATDITHIDSNSHTFASAHCVLTGAHFLSVECIDDFFRKVNVEAEPVGSAQQLKSSGVTGRGSPPIAE